MCHHIKKYLLSNTLVISKVPFSGGGSNNAFCFLGNCLAKSSYSLTK